MKMKKAFLYLMFGLLAVGWTSSAYAQPATYKAADMATWTYTWENAQGQTQTSNYVVWNAEKEAYEAPEVHDAYQIYGLLRAVYMNTDLPGPWQSAYKADGVTREDDVFYGGCDNGWNIPGTYTGGTTSTIGSLTINFSNYNSSNPIFFSEIRIASSTKLIAKWNIASNGTTLPSGWTRSGSWTTYSYSDSSEPAFAYFTGSSGSITIPASVTQGYDNVEIVIEALHPTNNTNYGSINVNNANSQTISDYKEYGWNVNRISHKTFASNTYKPTEDGYTAIAVAMKNTSWLPSEPGLGGSTGYNSPDSVINYIAKNIEYVKLLTDGLRITDQGGNPGTVFNCDGSYNKFFFLGKGKARQKGAEVQSKINSGAWAGYAGECVVFWPLFEEFSPTTAKLEGASTVVDFFDRMNEGHVYDVVHDCAGVIQNRHEFTLAGEDKEDDYPFTGMNFFIPDYRLKYWVGRDSTRASSSDPYTYVDVDGRDMNAMYTTTGSNFRPVSPYYSNYAQYNPDYAPKVGIYKITLSAVATFVGDPENPNHEPGNQNYVVTLTWVSSLNEMAGYDVEQTYTVYYWDPKTGERKYVVATGITNGQTGLTTVSYLVDQEEHSYTIEYIVMGTPDDSEHPNFVAWSNRDNVVIPGWDDFVGLQLDHHESDFVVGDMANYYRNFLEVVNEDIYNGLTVSKIEAGMNTFTLYRYEGDVDPEKPSTPIARITFGTPSNGTVPYTITYLNDQVLLETPKYNLDENHLNIPLTGVVRVKGNGDIVIWPNSYHVNFKSIKIYNNNTLLQSWEYTQNNLPSNWIVSPGSEWENFVNNGDRVGYMEGGGYIAIPNMLNNSNYDNLRVEIVAYGDGASVARITVNDRQQTIANGTAATYKWGGNDLNEHPLSPYAAPKRDNNGSNSTPKVAPSTTENKPVGASNGTTNSNVPFNKTNKR